MHPAEPSATALLLTVFGVLLALSVVFSRGLGRVTIPTGLIFLAIGMLAGSEGIGGIRFDDFHVAFRLGTVALVLILFDGGLNTPMSAVKAAARPAAVLATFGVVATAGLVATAAHLLGFEWRAALLLGAIVSSTDAAAVFAVLRGSGLQLSKRVGTTLEVESGLNDPMAMILTVALTASLTRGTEILGWHLALDIVIQLAVGATAGLAIGFGGRRLLGRLHLPASGLYPVITLALALLAFGLPTLILGSGFLAVYVAAVVLGNGALPFRSSLLRVHDALAWLAQIIMFLVLGLLVFPSQLPPVALSGLILALFLAIVARPLVVSLCLAPFGYAAKEIGYVGWVGLRGAVPIILALVPVLGGAPGAAGLFNVVFFIVVISALIPGSTVPWVTRMLGLESKEPPAPQAVLQIESRQELSGELMSFYVDASLAVSGVPLSELFFPDGAAVMLIVRGHDLLPPRGSTVLKPGDHVYLISRPEDKGFIQLLFGRPEVD
ncbi:MAG: potassium/proton antiporter [Gemmatimonadota bacterium]